MIEITTGMIVRSKAGRDKGDLFVVLKTEGNYAYIANGHNRRVDRPKKKKLMHLQLSGNISESVKDMLETRGEVTDSEVRKALAEYSGN